MSASIPFSTLSNIIIQAFAGALINFSDKAKIILFLSCQSLFLESFREQNYNASKRCKVNGYISGFMLYYPVKFVSVLSNAGLQIDAFCKRTVETLLNTDAVSQ